MGAAASSGMDIELESIQASDFESDTIRDSDKNLNESGRGGSGGGGRASLVSSPPVLTRAFRPAPIVHMHSICSMSDTASSSVQNSATNMRLLVQQSSGMASAAAPQQSSDAESNLTPTKPVPNFLNLSQTYSSPTQPSTPTVPKKVIFYYDF